MPTDTPPSAFDILTSAANLLEQEGKWTQGENARLPGGAGVDPKDRDASCWCLEGALEKVSSYRTSHAAYVAMRRFLGVTSLHEWNDEDTRTQEEVVAALRLAAALARAGDA